MINAWNLYLDQHEIDAIGKAIWNRNISMGDLCEEFEKKICEQLACKHAVATTSGTVALALALMAAGIKRGDEIIVPNRTFIATANAVLLLGAKVILVDIESPDRQVMDVDKVKAAITDKTRAIIPVHFNGQSVDIEALTKLARENDLIVIEDACQAIFCQHKDRYLGTFADMGCFSFGMSKLISSGQGGMVITNDNDLAEKMTRLRNHGVLDRGVTHFDNPGFNFKYTDIQAAMALTQLTKLEYKKKRMREIYSAYESFASNTNWLKMANTYHQGEIPLYVEMRTEKRDDVITWLREHGIIGKKVFANLHDSDFLNNPGEFPNCIIPASENFFVPSGPDIKDEEVQKVIEVLARFSN